MVVLEFVCLANFSRPVRYLSFTCRVHTRIAVGEGRELLRIRQGLLKTRTLALCGYSPAPSLDATVPSLSKAEATSFWSS